MAGDEGAGRRPFPQALRYAVANAAACGLADRARFVCGDWAAALAGSFDCIVTNPPYIGTAEPLSPEVRDYEPGTALFAGPDGLDDYRLLAPELRRLLAPGGAAVVEIGHEQAASVTALLEAEGFAVTLHRDLGGRPARCWRIEHSRTMPHISLEGHRSDPLERAQGTRTSALSPFFGAPFFRSRCFGPMPIPFVMQSLLSGGRGSARHRVRQLRIARTARGAGKSGPCWFDD